jgi:tetratricopeptide (TPR) repeat protein
MTRTLVVALVLVATVAEANVWKRAIDAGSPDPSQDVYDSEMKSGDELTLQATATHSASKENIRQLVQHAIASYRNAAQAKPEEAEPYYRIGRLIYSFYFECGDSPMYQVNPSPLCPDSSAPYDKKRAQEVIDAWDAFEARAPLDPRLSPMRDDAGSIDFNVLFHRAVLHTRLVTKDNLIAATKDYEKIVARSDSPDETTLSNLAETYMMLDRLDDAIETYRAALRSSRNTETLYGLAVALDRDERGQQARELILAQGEQAMAEFHRRVSVLHQTFFVPYGEEFYYFALSAEAFGMTESAIDYWNKYLRSGAHPEYQPRARAHLEPLLLQRKRKNLHLETPWHEIFH